MEQKDRRINMEEIKKAWKIILTAIGENTDREGLRETPERIARMYTEIFRGYNPDNKPKLTTFDNNSDGIYFRGMICDKGYFFSHCEHHGVPFIGEYFFAYVPDKKIIGLSKVARIVDFFSAKLQIQERLTQEILNEIASVLNPKGAILVLKARHLCKDMRGVKKNNGFMITSESTGIFKENKDMIKEEFFNLMMKQNE